MTFTEQVYDLIEQNYATSHQAQRPEWIHNRINKGYDNEAYTLSSVRAAFTRLHKAERINYNGEYAVPTTLSTAARYLHPQTATEVGLAGYSTPTPGFLCRLCGAVIASPSLHDAFHDRLEAGGI